MNVIETKQTEGSMTKESETDYAGAECEICEQIIVGSAITHFDEWDDLHVLCSYECREKFVQNENEREYERITSRVRD